MYFSFGKPSSKIFVWQSGNRRRSIIVLISSKRMHTDPFAQFGFRGAWPLCFTVCEYVKRGIKLTCWINLAHDSNADKPTLSDSDLVCV
jgi:hypothetical protein